ncbi:MAG: hypothetical protein ABIO49_08365 [Dokdonella sp.]
MQTSSSGRRWPSLVALAVSVACASNVVLAASGDLDTTFGTAGKLIIDFATGGHNYAQAKAIARDGSGNVYLVGDAQPSGFFNLAIVKVNANGQLVTSFGTNGKLLIDFSASHGDYQHGEGAALDSSGNLYVAGDSRTNDVFGVAVTKIDPTGHLVTAFGTGGKAFAAIGYYGQNVAVDGSGQVYVIGGGSSTGSQDFVIAKFDTSGQLVANFGAGGTATVDFDGRSDLAYDIVFDTQGNLLLAGMSKDLPTGHVDMAVAKLDPNGHLITSFGTAGKTLIVVEDVGFATALARDALGNLFLAGFSRFIGGSTHLAAAKLDANGHLLAGFGSAGIKVFQSTVDFDFDFPGSSAVVDGNGGVYLGGGDTDFNVVQIDGGGNLVPEFGSGGLKRIDFAGKDEAVSAMVSDGNNRLYVAGAAEDTVAGYVMEATKLIATRPDPIFSNGFDGS